MPKDPSQKSLQAAALQKLAAKHAPRLFPCDVTGCKKSFRSDGDLQRHKSQAKGHDAAPAPAPQPIPAPAPALPGAASVPSRIPSLVEQLGDFDMGDASAAEILAEYGIDVHALRARQDQDRVQHADALEGDAVVEQYEGAGQPKGVADPPHKLFEDKATASGLEYWPFASKHDYDFADWLLSESISNAAVDRLLERKSVSRCLEWFSYIDHFRLLNALIYLSTTLGSCIRRCKRSPIQPRF